QFTVCLCCHERGKQQGCARVREYAAVASRRADGNSVKLSGKKCESHTDKSHWFREDAVCLKEGLPITVTILNESAKQKPVFSDRALWASTAMAFPSARVIFSRL